MTEKKPAKPAPASRSKKPADQRYKAEMRWEKNKRRRIESDIRRKKAKQAKNIRKGRIAP